MSLCGGAVLRLQVRHRCPGKGLGQGMAGPGLGEGGQKARPDPDLWARLLDCATGTR